jgi:uncharacterized protein YndB with AHSA1/START domain
MQRSVDHGTFTIERAYAAAPARVFAVWTRVETKRRWASCHDDWETLEPTLDARVGGGERHLTRTPSGEVHLMEARFLDVVPDQRLVYVYEMRIGEVRISVSLATVELRAEAGGTRMVFTEQVAFLDGHGDLAEREEGTAVGLDRLAPILD